MGFIRRAGRIRGSEEGIHKSLYRKSHALEYIQLSGKLRILLIHIDPVNGKIVVIDQIDKIGDLGVDGVYTGGKLRNPIDQFIGLISQALQLFGRDNQISESRHLLRVILLHKLSGILRQLIKTFHPSVETFLYVRYVSGQPQVSELILFGTRHLGHLQGQIVDTVHDLIHLLQHIQQLLDADSNGDRMTSLIQIDTQIISVPILQCSSAVLGGILSLPALEGCAGNLSVDPKIQKHREIILI